jgi:hypothetical protein
VSGAQLGWVVEAMIASTLLIRQWRGRLLRQPARQRRQDQAEQRQGPKRIGDLRPKGDELTAQDISEIEALLKELKA